MAAPDREMHSPSQKMLTCTSPDLTSESDPPYVSTTTSTKINENSSAMCSLVKMITFQALTLFAVARLFIYIFKIFEDGTVTKEYYHSGDINFAFISAACLAIPPLFYAIYLIGEHLTRSSTISSSEIGTKLVNGLLLFPWQIKRHLDVLHYAAQRVCLWRRPSEREVSDLQSIKRTSETLEFFEDIYAGFMQIVLQTYLLFISQSTQSDNGSPGVPSFRKSQLVASSLCVLSMLIAVRRRDDGPLTVVFSMLGWSSIFTSRILTFTLGTIVLRGWISVFFISHVITFTWWVYTIAVQSHRQVEVDEPRAPGFVIPSSNDVQYETHTATGIKRTGPFTALLVFLFFGIPSLLIWPFMFQLRQKKRPYIFLAIIAVENVTLTLIYFLFNRNDVIYPVVSVASTGIGCILLSLYLCIKPSLTDQVVLFNIREARSNVSETGRTWIGQTDRSYNATVYGIYYEFCDLVFKLPSTHRVAADMSQIQSVLK